MRKEKFILSAKNTLENEANALFKLSQAIDDKFSEVVDAILNCKARIVVTGIGKSGHVGRKIASTLASTGTPAFFVHAAEAIHGDLGMITEQDLVIAISYSGQSDEFSTILPLLKRTGTKVIAITGNQDSELAKISDFLINVNIGKEACPLGLAPTTSTTATMAIGDAIAIACLEARQFSQTDFARSHPGGSLGRKLLTKVSHVMRSGNDIPLVSIDMPLMDALIIMSEKRMGMSCVVDHEFKPIGIFTDGDLRRLIQSKGDIRNFKISDVLKHNPKTISEHAMAIEAAHIMELNSLNNLLVIDSDSKLIGTLHMHDLMRAKVI